MINFPDSPAVNQTFTAAGVTWVWDGIKWNMSSIAGSPFISISPAPPANPTVGALWWDSIGGQLYIWFNDGNSTQWVSATNQGFGGTYLPLVGGNLSGPLMLAADPVNNLGAATKQYVDNSALNDNRIINGDMWVCQRGTIFTPAGSGNIYTLDRWALFYSQASRLTINRAAAGTAAIQNGIGYYLNAQAAGAYTPLATDSFSISQAIEADLIADFAWGQPTAQPVTLSFWATSNASAGPYGGSIQSYNQGASTRSYPFAFNIPAVGIWYKFTITIPGDIAGTWVTQGISGGLWLNFDLGCGANLRAPAGAWVTGIYNGATGTVQVVNNGNLFISNVKLEVGRIATDFNRQTQAKKYADCLRYFCSFSGGIATITANGSYFGTIANLFFSSYMRAPPTIVVNTTPGGGFVGGLQSSGITNLNAMLTANTAQTSATAYCSFNGTATSEL